ncbi:MAG: hypothetical protein K6F95_11430 [Selenomonas sp.]|uniref:pilus assembly protein TadG-related protein n=1 Tax=Selenomonas sp. TaxID=2053611 RepID=UPI0025F7C87B|nr:pilus assembly protein TadG-related protein [Selenomonas sp.]MCR5758501.1 hypothetical protein [Selenomonas sp.]
MAFIFTRIREQRGAVFVLSALLLPMLIVCTGLAMDLGHIYVQYSRLQNAADAAVLAGAHVYAVNNEQVDAHPLADEEAKQYIQGQYNNLDKNEKIRPLQQKNFQAKKKGDVVYYRVKLVKDVPLYFLARIKELIDGTHTFAVPVVSIAAINCSAEKGGFFNNLFIFKDEFAAVNSLNNPDKLSPSNPNYGQDAKNMITTVFDGRIVYTKGDGHNNPQYRPNKITYSTQTALLDRFFTSEAKKYNGGHNIKDLMESEAVAEFSSDGKLNSGYWSQAEYYNYDFQAFYDYMKTKTASTTNRAAGQDIKTSEALFQQDIILVPHTNSISNVTITVDQSLPASDKPIYVYVEAGMGIVNINLNADTGRPLIICIGGMDTQRAQVHFNLNGHTFKGVVYAPYCNANEGVLVNADNSTFMGTIVGSKIDLRGNNSTYIYKDYMGDKGTSGGKTSLRAENIKLVSPPDDIKWD